MADWTTKLPEAALAYLDGKRLDEVECIVSDLPGIAPGQGRSGQQIRKAKVLSTCRIQSIYQTDHRWMG